MSDSNWIPSDWYSVIQNWKYRAQMTPSAVGGGKKRSEDGVGGTTDLENEDLTKKEDEATVMIQGVEQTDIQSPAGTIVDALLRSLLKGEKDDILRINLLLFLQENSISLIEDDSGRFERVYQALYSIVQSPNDSFTVKCQTLTSMTTMVICESMAMKTQVNLVEGFINLLIAIISRVNQSVDRLLRGTACLCLLEFELTYPCLLAPYLPYLIRYSQAENTHIVQHYTSLCAEILQNAVVFQYTEETAGSLSPNLPGGIQIKSAAGSVLSSSMSGGVLSPPSFGSTPTFMPGSLSSSGSRPTGFQRAGITRTTSSSNIVDSSERTNYLQGLGAQGAGQNAPPEFKMPNIKYAPVFSVPRKSASGKNHRMPELVEKEIFKCATAIADQSAYLNQWGLLTIVMQLIPIIDIANIPYTFFRNHLHLLYKFFFTNNTVPYHLVLYLRMIFPDLYTPEETELLFKRLMIIIDDPYISSENHILAMFWLLSLTTTSSADAALLSRIQVHLNLYPTTMDSLPIKEAKIYALCSCLVAMDVPPPSDLLKALICLEEFKSHTSITSTARVVFSSLLLILTSFPSAMYTKVEVFVSDIFTHYPQFLGPIIELINGIADRDIRTKLFLQLAKIVHSLSPMRFLTYLPYVERIVLEEHIDPSLLLSKIFELIRRKNICHDGNWYIGNMVLSICRRVIVCHHIPFLMKPLRLILATLSYYFSNIEIRDRAQYYDRLITHLPDDKIKTLLNNLQIVQNEQSNLSGLVGGPISPSFTTLKSLPHFISVLPNLSFAKPIQHSFQLDSFESDTNNTGIDYQYHLYQSYLKDPQKLSAKVVIPHQITYKKNIGSSIPMKIYALLLQFQQSSHYSPINPVRIPYLCYPEQQPDNPTSTNLEFPYSYDVDLTFKPLYPIPTTFSLKMIFNDDEGKTCKADGSNISIKFQDLFMKLPVPPAIDAEPQLKNQFLNYLFEKIWKSSESTGSSSSNSIASSVKQISIQQPHLLDSINSKLSLYLIKDQSTTKEEASSGGEETSPPTPTVIKAIVFLPPQYHLLFKFEISPMSTIIHIKTDYWRSLACIDQYILYLISK